MATPNAMPKKANPLHQQILGALVANRPVTKLARNVSDENIDRLAKRWLS
ncbi:hypothetical protein PBI_MYXUS_68 [Mycobacterium phage Myxus]|uniref:Uncharacterized protein n=6 Tax=Fromanvirus packman TaxID=1034142 RepID=G1BR73_9CAUD|nr:hypothetical protein AVV05_gp040 [Mycobacterium phage Pioneer]YP_009301892.1 hypothetical protein BJD80_gp041 [Mycobacterium phage Catalina]YP_009636037.1 hypothetical protein FGG56_gp36 [Mycobacterium phage PackMan]AMO43936.1 hypothetical protein PBI_MYXUS_68 [Mycobacterium phage Myxus]AOQ29025.1 hypothetical protein SEA_HORTUMSL17_69 [Mycobacterium phage HortumSL17]AOY12052.1 hypothetical protein SEA_PHAEDER_68 [Mycobacterium phage Phaeder]AVI04175.1 hypothetical protein SEA_PHONNEGUT_69